MQHLDYFKSINKFIKFLDKINTVFVWPLVFVDNYGSQSKGPIIRNETLNRDRLDLKIKEAKHINSYTNKDHLSMNNI